MNATQLGRIDHVGGFMVADGDDVRPVTNIEMHDFLTYQKHRARAGVERGECCGLAARATGQCPTALIGTCPVHTFCQRFLQMIGA